MRIPILLTVAAGLSLAAGAVPAKPGLILMQDADGRQINVRLIGDERHHYYLTEDGYPLVCEEDSFFYASVGADGHLLSSGIRACPPAMRDSKTAGFLRGIDRRHAVEALDNARALTPVRRGIPAASRIPSRAMETRSGWPGLYPGSHFPARGRQKALVILVEYQDIKMTLGDAHDYFSRALNEQGFSDYGGTGSARDYFIQSSSGVFEPEFDVYGPVTLPRKRSYYGANGPNGDDMRPWEMVTDACAILDPAVDFSQYDCDGDGVVDNVFVFYAGRGEASGGPASSVWPHAYYVSAEIETPVMVDGVRLDHYACTNEYEKNRPDGIGTFVHEFSHVMGLPDLYATSYTSAFTPGEWSALDVGPYNNDGCTPPHYSAFERFALGWMEPVVLGAPATVTLEPIYKNRAAMAKTDREGEYFLFENRQKDGWDSFLPGHGMLIWHIDYNESVWDTNTVNNSAAHQYVDIIEADNIRSDFTRDGDTFPGASGVTSFTSSTTPSFTTWSKKKMDLPITDITEHPDGTVSFNVCGGGPDPMSAIDAPSVAAPSVRVEGLTLHVGATGPVTVCNTAGLTVARSAANDGTHTIMLPSAGMYIVTYPGGACKIIAR